MRARCTARRRGCACGAGSLRGAALSAARASPRPKQPFADPAQALQLQQLARERVQSIRAEARVDQRGAEGRIKGTVLMFVERPDRVRFDAMTQFGPAAILTSDGERFAYADLRNKRFLTGADLSRRTSRACSTCRCASTRRPRLLLGGTPVIDHTAAQIAWNDDGFYRIVLRGARRRQPGDRLRHSGARHGAAARAARTCACCAPRSSTRAQERPGAPRTTTTGALTLGAYHIAMPFEVRVEQPQHGGDTLIRFKEIALNVDVPQGRVRAGAAAGTDAGRGEL